MKKNVVILDNDAGLQDGTHVIVIPEEKTEAEPDYNADPFLHVESWAPDPPEDAPKDLASNHDLYLYLKAKE